MALYRCAACGSSHVVADTKKEGFSVSKAVVGTALFGTAGAVMGINGKEQMYYHCANCGQVLSYTMGETKKWMIDYALEHKEFVVEMEKLENLKKQYPGIEWSEADSQKARKVLNSKVQNITDEIVSECIDFIMKKSITSHNELAEYLSNEGYNERIIRESKRKIAWKENISIKLILRDDKLYYELCHDEIGYELRHNNIVTFQKCEALEDEASFQNCCSELEKEIISALSKHEEPVLVTVIQKESDELSFYTIMMIRRAMKDLCEKQIVKETVINQKAYFSLVKEDLSD